MRELSPGMGQAVAERTVLRTVAGKTETWGEVAARVAFGNTALTPMSDIDRAGEYYNLFNHISDGRLLMSGRHLQHGDGDQPNRNMEVFTNCATACTSTTSYHLLLNGSGVGRSYDDDLMKVDWDKAPRLRIHLDRDHPDYKRWKKERPGFFTRMRNRWKDSACTPVYHLVEDSREGWAKALELYETMTYEERTDSVLILDFSHVREYGAPIGGMQGRPSSGPVPTMKALLNIRDHVVGQGMPMWEQAMHVDHYMAESVLVGGARRAARIAVKHWKDLEILRFIKIKQGGQLWSANNSVGVDEEFWELATNDPRVAMPDDINRWYHAQIVFTEITWSAYKDRTGEPAFLNLHKLNGDNTGLDEERLLAGEFVGSEKFQLEQGHKNLLGAIAASALLKQYQYIVNPCGEIVLHVLGGFCVIADVVPFHCRSQEEFEDACRAAVRSLMRVNTMDSIYKGEVLRTNRIGVGCTGLHEFAWSHFREDFNHLVNSVRDPGVPSYFWFSLDAARRACEEESVRYAAELGVNAPLTVTTIKPAGTTSKLFGLTEGCHLPAMPYYLRWVQMRSDDPLVIEYRAKGYPARVLDTYAGMTIVGFPTKPTITDVVPAENLVTAGEATMEDQFYWLQGLEEHWLGPDKGNQLSYTMKYDPDVVPYREFADTLMKFMPHVRCVSVMPQIDQTAYEYQPEEPITKEEYDALMERITAMTEDIGMEHLECGSGGCPIDFKDKE